MRTITRRSITPAVLVAAVLVAALLLLAGACGDESETAATPEAAGTGVASASALYADHCAECHGDGGEGASGGPDLVALTAGEQASIEEAIRDGVGSMPPYEDELTPEEIGALAGYVAGLE